MDYQADFVFVNEYLREGRCPICQSNTVRPIKYTFVHVYPTDEKIPPHWDFHAAPPDGDLKMDIVERRTTFLGRQAVERSVRCDKCRHVFRGPCIQEYAFDAVARDIHDRFYIQK